ncbi:MAG: hypothetical protein LBI53_03100 [Candidatus Peribacteria bacterium]|nr:hypothetical protein [Candidatus Peribacteria bacterium]
MVFIGIIIVFLLFALCSGKSYKNTPRQTSKTAEIMNQNQKKFNASDFESYISQTMDLMKEEIQKEFTTVQKTKTNKASHKNTSFQTSLYFNGSELVGFVKDSDKKQFKTSKKSLQKYSKIVSTTNNSLVFVANKTRYYPMIYEILGQQPVVQDFWA